MHLKRVLLSVLPKGVLGWIKKGRKTAEPLIQVSPAPGVASSRDLSRVDHAARAALVIRQAPLAEGEISEDELGERMRTERSFEFQGIVVGANGEKYAERIFRRTLPEMGLMIDTRAMMHRGLARRLEEFREYEIGIEVSADYQREHHIVVYYDTVATVQDYLTQWQADQEEVNDLQKMGGMIIFRLDNITDESTHQVIRTLHNFVSDLIEAGAGLLFVSGLLKSYQRLLFGRAGQRVIVCQWLERDPLYESKLKAVIQRHFPGLLDVPLPEVEGSGIRGQLKP